VNFLFEKKYAGIWVVDLFSTTYFDENIIFVLSKDQTFRIRCTLMNPAQFLILVTHLLLQKKDHLSSYIGYIVIVKFQPSNPSKGINKRSKV
jgi:hypothetical protein